jgi:hypothetical protein
MMMVFINGIAQVPGADYVAGDSTVSFCAPPPVNSTIQVTTPKYNRLMFNGDGKTYTFKFTKEFKEEARVSQTLQDAYKYMNVPAVADMLEQLRVVVELVKEDDIVC